MLKFNDVSSGPDIVREILPNIDVSTYVIGKEALRELLCLIFGHLLSTNNKITVICCIKAVATLLGTDKGLAWAKHLVENNTHNEYGPEEQKTIDNNHLSAENQRLKNKIDDLHDEARIHTEQNNARLIQLKNEKEDLEDVKQWGLERITELERQLDGLKMYCGIKD